MQNRWNYTALALVMVLATTVSGCGQSASTTNRSAQGQTTIDLKLPKDPAYTGKVVAAFKGGELTKQEFDEQYDLQVVLPGIQSRESKAEFLKYYIVWYKYLYSKAIATAQTPVNATSAQQAADQSISGLVGTQYKTKQDVLDKLKSLNLTPDALVSLAEKGQILQQYLQSQLKNVTVSDNDAKAYYNAHQNDFVQVTVDQILLSSEQKAKQIEAKLKAGGDFAKLADQNSIDPSVKQNHGHFDNTLVSSFVPQFAKACETLPIGTISDPVQTQFGYHVLRVDNRTQLSFDKANSQIKIQLLPEAQRTKEQQIYSNAKKDAAIVMKGNQTDL